MPNEPNPFSDEIHIEQLEVSSVIGVSEHERKTPQRLTINISFWPGCETRDMADKIGQTINYAIVAEETQRFVSQQCSGEYSGIARPVSLLCYSPAPDRETGHQEQRNDTGYSVREFDDSLRFSACPDYVAIAQGPPISTAST